jgi:hypothetical protein
MQDDRSTIGVALVLIFIGLFVLSYNVGLFGDADGNGSAGQMWPGIIFLVGLVFLYQFFFGAEPNPGLVFVGTAATLLGVFLLFFTLHVELPFEFGNLSGPIDRDDLAYLWPALPLIGGIAFVAMSLFSHDQDEFGLGLVAMFVGIIAFPFALGTPEQLVDLVKFWPLVLILAGGRMLFKQALRL